MRCNFSLAVLCGVMCSTTWAQSPPDAGSLMRQTEQMLRLNVPNAPRREALPQAMPINEQTLIEVKRIQFHGNRQLNSDQLHKIAAPFENRSLRQNDLMQLSHAVSDAYRQTGWVVNVYVPRQNMTSGDLILQVIETIPPLTTP